MTANFQETLKALGKQAKKEAAEREAEAKAKKQVEDVDFSKAVGKVTPLKNAGNYYEQPRDKSPIKPRPKEMATLEQEDYFYVGSGGWEEPPASFSKNGQGKNDLMRLRNGHYPVVADVDLHGYTQEEAMARIDAQLSLEEKKERADCIIENDGTWKETLAQVIKAWKSLQ